MKSRKPALHSIPTSTCAPPAKLPFTQKGKVLQLRHRFAPVDVFMRVIDGYRDHRTAQYSALLSHFGFMSIFPLFAALSAILGFVLEGNKDLRESIVNSALANVPIIGPQIKDHPEALTGSAFLLIFGIVTSLWAGTKAFVAAQSAMNAIWEVPQDVLPNLVTARGRALMGIGLVGLSHIGSGVLSGFIAVSGTSWTIRLLLSATIVLFNTLMLVITYRVLTACGLQPRHLVPGAIVAAVALFVIQILTSTIVSRALQRADSVYGTFGGVIALFGWLGLNATAALFGVELNAALDRRRVQRLRQP